MIVTVTPNPSIDRTVTLATPLTRGAVHRVTSVTTEAGGKGVNVARALTLAAVNARATLTPLPPASVVTEVTRCTLPRVSGVVRVTVRSMLGLGVTVTITGDLLRR